MGTDIRIALTLFTVLVPAGALAYVGMAILVVCRRTRDLRLERLEHYLIVPLAVCLVGLIASATHLGTPSNALYVLAGWGRSPLSNEVVAALGFLFVAGLCWLASFSRRLPFVLGRLWLVLACGAALWLVAMISRVYAIPTIPTWDDPLVTAGLWALALCTGPLLACAVLRLSALEASLSYQWVLLAVSALGSVAVVLLALLQNARLAQVVNPFAPETLLVPWYPWCILAFSLLAFAALVMGFLSMRTREERGLRSSILAAASASAVLIAAACIRIAFYAMHLTVGL